MHTITTSIVVECPVEEVFAFATDARNNPLWQSTSGLRGARQMPESPVGVGTQITEIWHILGMTAQSTSEVTAYEPGRCYTRHLLSGSGPITQGTHAFDATATGTQWTYTVLVQTDGTWSTTEPVLAAHLKQTMEAGMAKAKALLEQRVVDKM
ncbi:MAG: SRPBCC family protein [Nitrososphaerota archaeon]